MFYLLNDVVVKRKFVESFTYLGSCMPSNCEVLDEDPHC